MSTSHQCILEQGVECWNQWRIDNPEIDPDLSMTVIENADLVGCNLSGVDFYKTKISNTCLDLANLAGAEFEQAKLTNCTLRDANLDEIILYQLKCYDSDFSGANLYSANLRQAEIYETKFCKSNLSSADLFESRLVCIDLSEANLSSASLNSAKLVSVELSGSCIQDLHADVNTTLVDIECNYVFLRFYDSEYTERRPHDPNRSFVSGDFVHFIKKTHETVDLIFSQGIDWSAFLTSFQNLQVFSEHGEFTIQGINQQSDGSFVISIDAPPDIDKAAIEREFQAKYDAELEHLEAIYKKELNAKDREIRIYREQNTKMTGIIETLAKRTINVETNNVVGDQVISQKGDAISMKSTSHGQSKQVNIAKVSGGTVNISNNETTNPEIAATLAYIEALIADYATKRDSAKLSEQLAIATEVIAVLETEPDWKQTAVEAAKVGALEVLKSNPVGVFVARAIEDWTA